VLADYFESFVREAFVLVIWRRLFFVRLKAELVRTHFFWRRNSFRLYGNRIH
jgi:hypothetical protein